MKTILSIALLTCCAWASQFAMAGEQTATINVKNMYCALCPVTVRKAMEHVAGVEHVEVDFDSKTATVTFDDAETNTAAIAQASTNVGYPASPVKDE